MPGKAERADPRNFYARALTRAERVRLASAHRVQGLDDEISLLRVKLLDLLERHPDRFDLLLRGVNLLLRAVVARYRLSPKASRDLADNISRVLEDVGGALGLEGFTTDGKA